MAPKRKQTSKPTLPAPFRTAPFSALKGVVVESPPVEQAADASRSPRQPQPAVATELPDDLIFLQAMGGVRRLNAAAMPHKTASGTSAAKGGPVSARQQHKAMLPRDEVAARKAFLQEVEKLRLDVRFEDAIPTEDELRPLSGNRLRQLKRGIIQLDRQLDLHGLTREEALDALTPFLQAARQAGEKAVLVITGKGFHSADGPVLQQVVAGWLRDQGRELISEYAPAPRELGGGGAFVIFLRPLDK